MNNEEQMRFNFMARLAHDAITIVASKETALAKVLGDRYETIIGHRERP